MPGADAASDAVAWAHLSDFHFTDGPDYGRDEVQEALLEDLETFAGKRPAARGAAPVALDFVVVTGDIAARGTPKEYVAARSFFERISAVTGVPLDRFFPVPGNHDVDRAKDLPARMLRDAVDGHDAFEVFWKSLPMRRSVAGEKLGAYREFARGLNPQLRIPDEQPGGFSCRIECRGRAVAFLGLSSCWLSGTDAEKGRLITGKSQAYDLGGGVKLPSLGEADLRLALMHHPLAWMQDFDQAEMEQLLPSHVDLLLRGHLHRTDLSLAASPAGSLFTIAAGSCFAGSRYRNAYNITRVHFGAQRTAKVWLRAYARDARCFVADVETYPEAETGDWTWKLAGTTRPATRKRRAPAPVDVRPYLEKLCDDTRWLEFRGMGQMVAERTELERVYTRLRVAGPATEDERGEQTSGSKPRHAGEALRSRDLELKDVLQDNRNLVLIGDPGAGKTTFLRFVALNVAGALLVDGADERGAHLGKVGLRGDPPFPVFVSLGGFGQFLGDHPNRDLPDDSPEHFYRYLDFSRKGYDHLPEGELRRRVLEGGCLLLLDGLDEVPGQAVRERVGKVLDGVVSQTNAGKNRHLVTCRTRAYSRKAEPGAQEPGTGTVQLGPGFARCHLVDFGPEEVAAFVGQWSRALHRVGPDEAGTAAAGRAAEDRGRLLAAIRDHPHVLPLTANPLMLTILAVVHWNQKKLPEQRAELYEAAVKYLLGRHEKQSGHKTTLREDCLRAVALRMFEDPSGVRKSLARREAAEAVAPLLAVDTNSAEAFVEDEELHSGVLVSRRGNEVEFWHPTFGEYLAAQGLAFVKDYWDRIQGRLFDERWNEVVLLLAGCRRKSGLGLASEFIEKILTVDDSLAGRARAVGLVGRILRDIGPAGGDPARGTGYTEALGETLGVFEKGGTPVPEAVRVEVGEALGQAGDPRLHDDDHEDRVEIRGGRFWMGAQNSNRKKPWYDEECDSDEAPVRQVRVSSFFMDRYPVTVRRFTRFVEDGGYRDQTLWDPDGWGWRIQAQRTRPGSWDEQLRHPNRPVVEVAWYEAHAYCAWLSRKTGREVRLPTEAEWEYAARGEAGRKYPWGDEAPTEAHANFELRVGHPTPVGIYPLGATPEGVRDLAGNVWEWCQDWYGPYSATEQRDPSGPAQGESRLLRGGGFLNDPRSLRAAFRYLGPPELVDDNVGFRCVAAGAGGQHE